MFLSDKNHLHKRVLNVSVNSDTPMVEGNWQEICGASSFNIPWFDDIPYPIQFCQAGGYTVMFNMLVETDPDPRVVDTTTGRPAPQHKKIISATWRSVNASTRVYQTYFDTIEDLSCIKTARAFKIALTIVKGNRIFATFLVNNERQVSVVDTNTFVRGGVPGFMIEYLESSLPRNPIWVDGLRKTEIRIVEPQAGVSVFGACAQFDPTDNYLVYAYEFAHEWQEANQMIEKLQGNRAFRRITRVAPAYRLMYNMINEMTSWEHT